MYCYAAHRDLHSFPTRRSSDLEQAMPLQVLQQPRHRLVGVAGVLGMVLDHVAVSVPVVVVVSAAGINLDRKSTRLNSSHSSISYAVFCLKKKTTRGRPLSRNAA